MTFSKRRLAEVRLWIFFVLLGLALGTTAACSSSDESSCQPGDSDYPECQETGLTD